MSITTQPQEETPPRSFRRSFAPEEHQTDGTTISLILERLRREHQALDEQIRTLDAPGRCYETQRKVTALKRQKLKLKEEIVRLEAEA